LTAVKTLSIFAATNTRRINHDSSNQLDRIRNSQSFGDAGFLGKVFGWNFRVKYGRAGLDFTPVPFFTKGVDEQVADQRTRQ